MSHYKNTNEQTAIILTFLFPFAGLVYSLANWRQSWAKNAFWLVCIYLGAVFVFLPEGGMLGSGADGGEYVLRLIGMYNDASVTFSSILSSYLIDEQVMDLYQPLLTFLLSRFTQNGHVLFAVFAFVFGFFYSRNIWYILEKMPNKKLGNLFVLVTLYFLVCPITQINGVRMWTALHVFVYGMMPYLLERDKSKLWWVLLTPLVHFSFLYVTVFAVVFYLLPYNTKSSKLFIFLAFSIFIVSIFVNAMRLNTMNAFLAEYSPEAFESRINMYVNEDRAKTNTTLTASTNWYVSASGSISHWCYNLLLIALFPCLKRNFDRRNCFSHLYVFALLFGAFANIMALIPSGGRFQLLSQMFKVPLILLVAMTIPQTDAFRKYVNIATIFLLLPFIFEIRKLLDYLSITAFCGNYITVFFWENNVPLINFIKQLI